MGNISNSFCGQDKNAEKYLEMVQTAIKLAGGNNEDHSLLIDHQEKLETMIKNGQPVGQMLGRYMAQVVLTTRLERSNQSIINPTEKEMKLVLTTEVEESVRSLSNNSITQQGMLRQGYIIFPDACYYGFVLRQKAHGNGTLFSPGYEVRGVWDHDSFKRGSIYRLKPMPNATIQKIKYCRLELLNGERQAILNTPEFDYRGSITLKGGTKISEILTGEGVIVYKNGDKYNGQLVNGLYETQNIVSVYTYAEGQCRSFTGRYKNGLREDRGFYSIQSQGKRFRVNVKFSKGQPIQCGMMICEQDQAEYYFEVINSTLVLRSRLDSNIFLNGPHH